MALKNEQEIEATESKVEQENLLLANLNDQESGCQSEKIAAKEDHEMKMKSLTDEYDALMKEGLRL